MHSREQRKTFVGNDFKMMLIKKYVSHNCKQGVDFREHLTSKGNKYGIPGR